MSPTCTSAPWTFTGRVIGRAGGQLLDVEVAAVEAGPCVAPGLELRAGPDEPQHRRDGQGPAFAPLDEAVADGDDAVLLTDARAPEPAGHGAVGPAETGIAQRVERDRADVYRDDHARLGPFDENTAARRVPAAKEGGEAGAVGVAVEPGAAVERVCTSKVSPGRTRNVGALAGPVSK